LAPVVVGLCFAILAYNSHFNITIIISFLFHKSQLVEGIIKEDYFCHYEQPC